MENIGNAMKTLRETNGLTQREFAKLCDMSSAIVSQYESGYRNPSKKVLYRIVDKFNLDVSYFNLPKRTVKISVKAKANGGFRCALLDIKLVNILEKAVDILNAENARLSAECSRLKGLNA